MELIAVSADDIKPYKDKWDNKVEDLGSYIERVKSFLPRFPSQVIETWLWEHDSQIIDFVEFPLEKFHFRLEAMTLEELPFDDNGDGRDYQVGKNIDQLKDREYQLNMKTYNWPMQKIKTYIEQNGTWPVPPIVLKNTGGVVEKYDGYKCGIPYHLIEGHRRIAVMKFYKDDIELQPTHNIWLVSVVDD